MNTSPRDKETHMLNNGSTYSSDTDRLPRRFKAFIPGYDGCGNPL